MKKLSDYRIREENGKFVVEGRIEITERGFLRKFVNFEWHGLNVYGEVAGFCHQFDGSNVKIYTTLEAAKEQIIKWCEEPKYHYVREFEGYSYSPNFSKGCPWDFADFYKEQLSRAGIEIMEKCKKEKERKLEEAIKKAQEIIESAIIIVDDFAKTEQQMKEEITEKDVVDACKRQFAEKYDIPNTPAVEKRFSADDLKDARKIVYLEYENNKLKTILNEKEIDCPWSLDYIAKSLGITRKDLVNVIENKAKYSGVQMYSKMSKKEKAGRVLDFKYILNDAKQYASKRHISLAEGLFEVLKKRKMHIQQEV